MNIFLLEVCLFSAEEPRKQHLIENIPRQTLGRRRHLMSSFARSETANLVPLRLERSESASGKR